MSFTKKINVRIVNASPSSIVNLGTSPNLVVIKGTESVEVEYTIDVMKAISNKQIEKVTE